MSQIGNPAHYVRARNAAMRTAVPGSQLDLSGAMQAVQAAAGMQMQTAEFALDDRLKAEHDTRKLKRAEFLGEYDVLSAEQSAELDPLAADYRERVGTIHAELTQDILGRSAEYGQELTNDLTAMLTQHGAATEAKAVFAQRNAQMERGRQLGDAAATQALADIRADPAAADVYVAAAAETFADSYGVLNELERNEKADQFARAVVEAQVDGFNNAGQFAAARRTIDENAGQLDGSTVRGLKGLVKGAENTAKAEQARALGHAVANLSVDLLHATSPADVQALQSRLDGMKANGAFAENPAAWAGLSASIHRQRQDLIEKERQALEHAERMARVPPEGREWASDPAELRDRYRAGVDGLDRKAREETGDPNARAGFDDIVGMSLSFIHDHSFVPKDFTQMVQRLDNSGSAAQIGKAAELYEAVKLVAPSLPESKIDFGPRVEAVAALVEGTGLAPAAAAEAFLQNNLHPRIMEERAEAYTKKYDDHFRRSPSETLDRHFGGAGVTQGLSAEFRNREATYYQIHGDAELATKQAIQSLERQGYGVTNLGPEPIVQRYAPELVYTPTPNAAVNAEIIRGEVAAVLRQAEEAGFLERAAPGGKTTADTVEYILQPVLGLTDRQLEEGGSVEYALALIGDFGQAVPIDDGEGGFVTVKLRRGPDLVNNLIYKRALESGRATIRQGQEAHTATKPSLDAEGNPIMSPEERIRRMNELP